MSFNMADLVTAAIIEDRLDYLRSHPDHINWLLSPFVRFRKLSWMVGPNHIKQCIDYVMNVKPLVRPYYEMDLSKIPCICTASSQSEAVQFIGDYGLDLCVNKIAPEVIITTDVSGYDKNTLIAPISVSAQIWPNLWAVKNNFASRIVMIIDDPDSQSARIVLRDDIPSGTPMKEWKIQTSMRHKNYTIGSSTDEVTTTITLTTAGDHGIHRLMTTIVRYCLKSGRLLFDSYGMQVSRFSQQPIVLVDEEQTIWQTGFIVESKATDHWIDRESILDDSGPVNVDIQASSLYDGDRAVIEDM